LNMTAMGSNADAALTLLGLPHTLPYKITRDTITNRYVVQVDTNVILGIAPEAATVTALTYQNSSILTNLAAIPENRNPEAYQKLRQAIFPWTLPLDLWIEEIRAFLTALGVSRRRLIEIACPPTGLGSDMYVAEVLDLSAEERRQISQDAGTQPWISWGLTEQNNRVTDTIAGMERGDGWLDVLKNVSMVMQQSRLTYRDVLDVLQTSMGGLAKPIIQPPEECHPSKLTFTNINRDQLDWIRRFTRLRRRLGWSARELDRALAVFNNSIDLLGLSLMQRLVERLHVQPLSLSAVLGRIETRN